MLFCLFAAKISELPLVHLFADCMRSFTRVGWLPYLIHGIPSPLRAPKNTTAIPMRGIERRKKEEDEKTIYSGRQLSIASLPLQSPCRKTDTYHTDIHTPSPPVASTLMSLTDKPR